MSDTTEPCPASTAWGRLMALFLARYRGGTRESYTVRLGAYTRWCAEQPIDPMAMTRGVLQGYLTHLAEAGRAEATVAAYHDVLASIYRFAVEEELLDRDPTARIRRPRIDRDGQRRTVLTPLEYAAFLSTARKLGSREHVVAALGGMLGLRSAEMRSLDVTDLTYTRGYLVAKFVGKGSRHATVPLPVPVLRAVTELVGGRTVGPLLTNRDGIRMTSPVLRRMVTRIATEAGIAHPITPHGLRRTFATAGFANGVSLRDMQIAMRHARSDTTTLYDRDRANLDRHASHSVAAFLAGIAG